MAEKKQKRVKRTIERLPVGPFVYPKLVDPDYGSEDYPMPEGKFEVKVRLTAEQAAPYIEAIDDLAAAELAAAKKNDKRAAPAKKKAPWETKYLPYEAELDDEGDETGDFLFKANMKHSGVSKKTGKEWSRVVPLFDSRGTPIPRKGLQVWGGTEGVVAFTYIPYSPNATVGASVKLSLEAVQILTLVNGDSRDAGAYGFQEEEGFEAETTETEEPEEETTDEGTEDEDDF